MTTVRDARAASLRAAVEFDCPFTITAAGEIGAAPAGIYAPEIYRDEETDITDTGVWEALKGYTGQYSYSGAVMHSSEYLGGRIASDILATPGVYVVTVVSVLPENVCMHCERPIIWDESFSGWIDPEAKEDDSLWAQSCDNNDTFEAEHERDESPKPAGWAVLRLRPVAVVTCGICDESWDESYDPAPSALCHYCHGRGYSFAPVQS